MTSSDKRIELPSEYRFDVDEATRSLAVLAQAEPEASIVLTLATLNNGGLEAESDIYLTATSAAALLATVTEDQYLAAGEQDLVVLRVTRREASPPAEIEYLRD